MDISRYIQDLLWDYECVIIPGFGGILATYRPAEMILAEHRITPPSKALAFNEYLSNNDGLLINHICQKSQYSYQEASTKVDTWVQQTKQLLKNNEEIYLPSVGCFYRDVERNLQFTADTGFNYLSSTYGLPSVSATPLLRHSEHNIHVIEPHRASYTLPKRNNRLAMAALVLLFIAIGAVLNLMYQGVHIQPLNLNTASVLSFIEAHDANKPSTLAITPVVSHNNDMPQPVHQPKTPVVDIDTIAKTLHIDTASTIAIAPSPIAREPILAGSVAKGSKKYYIMVGAYQKPENLERAEDMLKNRFADAPRYEDTSPAMVRIGFYAADNYQTAFAKLQEARKDDSTYWLLVK